MDKIRKINSTKKYLVVLISIVVICLVVYGVMQYKEASSLREQVGTLSAEAKTNVAKSSKLNTENTNMKKAIIALQSQIKSKNGVAESADSSEATPAAKMTVTGVKHKIITRPANEYRAELKVDYLAISSTITNQSGSVQTYSAGDLYATTDDGKIIRPSNLADPWGDGSWVRSELANGGHEDVVILFPSEDNLVSLTFTIPGTSTHLTVGLPSAI